MELYYDVFPTSMGWFAALASGRGLRYASLRSTPQEALDGLGPQVDRSMADPDRLEEVRKAVQAYFSGERDCLDEIVLDLEDASPFHRAAWEVCRSIPTGESRSYAWVAAQAGSPGAFRAAGQAMARNRVHVVVPCHRVVGSNGEIYGRGGVEIRERLLRMETALQTPARPAD